MLCDVYTMGYNINNPTLTHLWLLVDVLFKVQYIGLDILNAFGSSHSRSFSYFHKWVTSSVNQYSEGPPINCKCVD